MVCPQPDILVIDLDRPMHLPTAVTMYHDVSCYAIVCAAHSRVYSDRLAMMTFQSASTQVSRGVTAGGPSTLIKCTIARPIVNTSPKSKARLGRRDE